MKKTLALVLALMMVVSCLFVFAGCSDDDDPSESKPADTSKPAEGGKKTLSVCLASEPASLDPALNSAVDGATMIIHAFAGLVGYKPNSEGVLELFADCAKELPTAVIGEDGKATYTFELKDGLKWSDGSALTAEDFVYGWNRAADPNTGSDYIYMFDVIDGYDAMQELTPKLDAEGKEVKDDEGNVVEVRKNPDAKLNVTVDGNKINVVLKNDVTYFLELCAFPTYMPIKSTIQGSNDAWATEPATYIGNGPYIMSSWEHNSKIVYTKNPNYYNPDAITVDEIEFFLSDDQNAMLANFKKGDWLFIDDVPNAEIKKLETEMADEYFVTGQLGTYYVIFNVNKNLLPEGSTLTGEDKQNAEAEIRKAFSLFFDRNYIVEEIGQAGQVPASTFVAMGLTDGNGKDEFYKLANKDVNKGEYVGYYNTAAEAFEANSKAAVETLKKYYTFADGKFTNVPSLVYLYNTSDGHKAIGEYLQGALAGYGITMTLENQEWNTFLETRKQGDYNIARNGWLADYNDPMSFLDMWLTNSGNNDAQFGKDAHKDLKCYSVDLTPYGGANVVNGTWAETYDATIALVKKEKDTAKRYALMHLAEDILMSTGAITPLYYYTDIFMKSTKLGNVYSSPLGYKYFMYASVTD